MCFCAHKKKERDMKKVMLFAGMMGIMLSAGAYAAEQIVAASTNVVRQSVYDLKYSTNNDEDTGTRQYKAGYEPQGRKLTAAVGTTPSTGLDSVAVGNLAATGTNAASAAMTDSNLPTPTVRANTANVAVLDRDKLVTPGAGNCEDDTPCGYVTLGHDENAPQGTSTDKVWMQIQ